MTIFSRMQPPPELEERVVRSLRARGSVGAPRRSSVWLVSMAFAAGVAAIAFVGGMSVQRIRQVNAMRPAASRYVLLLYGNSAPNPSDRPALVKEFREWTGRLKEAGQYLQGAELSDQSVSIGGSVRDSDAPTGMFVFVAKDSSEAVRIASDCPHIRRGGSAQLRPVVAAAP
jgi:hypothetical protein